MALIGAMLWRKQRKAALYALLMFVLYLRPGEALTMTSDQMVPPMTAAAGAAHLAAWGFIIGPSLLGEPSKTGVYDESVLLDWPELAFLDPLLRTLWRLPQGRLVWGFDALEFGRIFKQAILDVGLQCLAPVPYTLRHGGASHDILMKRRTIEAIKTRGRWRSDASVARYQKAARALQELNRLGPKTLAFARQVEERLPQLMLGRLPPTKPPRA